MHCMNKILTTLMLLLMFTLSFYEESLPLDIVFLDVGQGDASFIKTENKKMLMDAGPDNSLLFSLGGYMNYWDRKVDYLLISHPHLDHFLGSIWLLERYEVEKLFLSSKKHDAFFYNLMVETAIKNNVEIVYVKNTLEIPLSEKVVFHVLYPNKDLEHVEVENMNNASIVGKLKYLDFEVLYTGDAEEELEEELVELYGEGLNSDILKIGHHGSRTSTSLEFLEKVNPEFAVIQAGKDNPFSHPHWRTIFLLEKENIPYWRNDLDGNIHLKFKIE